MIKLDSVDRHLLGLLQTDASLTTSELAEKVGISQSPCWRRIKRLQQHNIIVGKTTLLNRRALGLNCLIFTEIKLSDHRRQALSEFEERIAKIPEVLECYTILGQSDYLLKIIIPEVGDYDSFFRDVLTEIHGVRETTTMVVSTEVKATTQLPLTP